MSKEPIEVRLVDNISRALNAISKPCCFCDGEHIIVPNECMYKKASAYLCTFYKWPEETDEELKEHHRFVADAARFYNISIKDADRLVRVGRLIHVWKGSSHGMIHDLRAL